MHATQHSRAYLQAIAELASLINQQEARLTHAEAMLAWAWRRDDLMASELRAIKGQLHAKKMGRIEKAAKFAIGLLLWVLPLFLPATAEQWSDLLEALRALLHIV